MSKEKNNDASKVLSDDLLAWLLLLKKLEDGITDPEMHEAFQRFVQLDNDMLRKSIKKAYRRGYAAGKAVKTK